MNNRLQELRWKKDWSQAKLSRLSGVPRTTISAIESGTTTNPSVETALLLSKALGMPVEDIFIL
ncbi:helix-turn-helix transcriptional regulator [Faecalicatena sp. AGMB00832]|uniref:Helix-turn-helix transcriptional regulator n=1 Tax=Faecalicatena faecalis TaxID=2726362 RepID=A0ABS6DAC1_9FIRM|nr:MULTISPECIES: helix-turn-helix transcriptional regulator [Faecalicatena]MBU3878036.1 helix-turn-helix transcriptional regulator [Faecalicatena faecalis]MCI6467688.1 helix-turn-helix transcriptional regulator [Faecalicatena sp.]MDY5616939.1 helix-turn-helix transcriptional regulator [Lachnospiraceae bacterium]